MPSLSLTEMNQHHQPYRNKSGSWSQRSHTESADRKAGPGNGMRRQRSLEWRDRGGGYSSSDDDNISAHVRQVDSHVFASLLAQAQQEYASE